MIVLAADAQPSVLRVLLLGAVAAVAAGCHGSDAIEVDLSTRPIRFTIDHHGWPRPFWYPRVTEFALASEEDGELWELHSASADGVPARRLVIQYGRVPGAFEQVYPAEHKSPVALEAGRTYFVAAGGPKQVYKFAFALPVEYLAPRWPKGRPTTRPRR